MAFSNLILTTGGKMVKAKVEQGSNFHILRVALGDGLLTLPLKVINPTATSPSAEPKGVLA